MENKIFYYYSDNNLKLKKARIRYFIYGGLLFLLGTTLFFLEMFNGFGITLVMDYFISISMVSDMILGIIYITKGIFLKDKIKAKSLFNLVNSKIIDNEVKSSMGLIKYLSIIPIIFNVTILVFYINTLVTKSNEISFVMVFSFIIGVLLSICAIVSFISIDGENEIYNKIDE